MLKTPAELGKKLSSLYERAWPACVLSEAYERCGGAAGVPARPARPSAASPSPAQSWPVRIALGSPGSRELEERFADVSLACDRLESWIAAHGLTFESENRRVGITVQRIPTHAVVTSMDALARACARTSHLLNVRARARRLADEFPDRDSDALLTALRRADRALADEVDFDLACRAGTWFSSHDASGLSPRQVPLEGFHAKWLDAPGRRAIVALLAGKERLDLAARPGMLRYVYLDPEHLRAGGRRHDCHVQGDVDAPCYLPKLVLITENRDTALWFPPVEGAIAVMGDGGAGPGLVSGLRWVRDAARVVYWGDIDTAGFEILNAYRATGLDVESMLMDMDAYQMWRRFGTMTDKNGRPLTVQTPAELPRLTAGERELYRCLCAPDWDGPRRVEQERIPLTYARDRLVSGLAE